LERGGRDSGVVEELMVLSPLEAPLEELGQMKALFWD